MSTWKFKRMDQRVIELSKNDIVLCAVIRNEAHRLPFFLEYYRKLGITRFFFIDNDSSDQSLSFLLQQEDTHVFLCKERYSESFYGVHWINQILDDYASGHWVCVVDADELLVYPNSEKIKLPELTQYLESQGSRGLMTFLLDMYADGPLNQIQYTSGSSFMECCPHFDSDSYEFSESGPFKYIPQRGGVRSRLFFQGKLQRGNPPFLPKIPLVFWTGEPKYKASTHLLTGPLQLDRTSGVLLHFKLFASFHQQARLETERKEHWDNAAQYEAYHSSLVQTPDLNPMYGGSVRYENSLQLLKLGFIMAGNAYQSLLRE